MTEGHKVSAVQGQPQQNVMGQRQEEGIPAIVRMFPTWVGERLHILFLPNFASWTCSVHLGVARWQM